MPLDQVANFRDVNSICRAIRPGRLYRSGHTLFASEEDADRLLQHYGIRTVIDLRGDGDNEMKKHFGIEKAPNRFTERLKRISIDKASNTKLSSPSAVNVPLAGAKQLISYIWSKATLLELILLMVFNLFCLKERAIAIIAGIFAREGLSGYSCAILSCSGDMISKVLKAVAVNSENGVLIHCSLGKDRTGVVVSLILMILGVHEDDIIKDYEESGRKMSLETRKAMLPDILDKEVFSKADGQVIRNLSRFIVEQYGGLDRYLDGIGFDDRSRYLLRVNLLQMET